MPNLSSLFEKFVLRQALTAPEQATIRGDLNAAAVNDQVSLYTSVTGSTLIGLPYDNETVYLKSDTASPVPAITFNLPSIANSRVGQLKTFVSSKDITSFTVGIAGGLGVIEGDAISSISAYSPVSYQCFDVTTSVKWLRLA